MTVTSSVSQLQAGFNDMSLDVDNLKSDLSNLHDKHLDLQTRSMRENLVFTGLPLTNETEDTEDLLRQFMRNEMKMDSAIDFHRAHRFGKESSVKDRQNRNLYNTRPIVCRFKNFKDREQVRYAASALKGTHFGVNEQFPKEINDRRKILWPYFKEAKSQKRKVHLKKDRLFIDGAEFIPPDRSDEARMETNERQLYIGRGARPKTSTHGLNNQTRNTGRDPQTKLDDLDDISLENFTFYCKNRKKFSNYRSGGLAFGHKSSLNNYITPIDSNCPFVFWFKICKKLVQLPQDLICGVIYIPPINTLYTADDAISEIEIELHNMYKDSQYVCLFGDFNSRTGTLADFYDIDDFDDTFVNELIDFNEFSEIGILDDLGIPRKRNSQDQTVNTYGRKLISFCKNNNIFILNGRFLSDKVGNPTSRNSSVVDYVMGSANIFHKIVDFEIMQFSNLYSDIHKPIFLQLDCNVKTDMLKENTCIRNNEKYIGKWKHEKSTDFKSNINRDEVNDLLSHILEIHDDISKVDQNSVNEIVTNVTKILLDSAEKTFGVVTKDCSNSKEEYNNKEWFNHDCKNSRRDYRKSLRLYKHYGSNIFKVRLRNSEKMYKKTMDDSIRLYNHDLKKKMKELRMKKPRDFWKIFNKFKRPVNNDIDIKQFYDFFKEMNKDTLNRANIELDNNFDEESQTSPKENNDTVSRPNKRSRTSSSS
ncbi:unnamed protein product [Mytilus edulis]|uniref:Endonuclease/exonuclease/phosphatase domain-containing protein n=1 Tax=Mytilus edulis TaxID=6550 RepID=A0A8S3T0S0_MYTED|nr:unnamed protein product [Mytilus edulis]